MALKVTFVDDNLRKDGSKIAKVLRGKTITFDEMLSSITSDGTIEEKIAREAFTRYFGLLDLHLAEGACVKTPLGSYSATLRSGGPETAGKQSRTRSIGICFRAEIEIVEPPVPRCPHILQIKNLITRNKLLRFTPGSLMQIRGKHLSFNAADTECGVFFVDSNQASENRSPFHTRNGSAVIDCIIPDVPQGSHVVEVRTRPTHRSVRVGRANVHITIDPSSVASGTISGS